jgi:hypothetical protein
VNRPAAFGIALGLAFALCACSSDNKDKPPTMTAGAGGGGAAGKGSAAGSGSGTAGGDATGTGSVPNGGHCNNTSQCATGLKCVLSVVIDQPVQVCAHACADDNACAKGEICKTETGRPADSHCIATVKDAFAACGPAHTSVCAEPLDCIFSNVQEEAVPEGFCYNYCLLPGSTVNDPAVLATCPAGLSCLPLGDPDVGLCAHEAARGGACGLDSSSLCNAADLCITTRSQNGIEGQVCYQDCTTDPKSCAAGTSCDTIPNGDGTNTGYCKPQ